MKYSNSNTSHFKIEKSLSKREKDVLKLILNGLENRAIARKLFLSTKTVENHKENIKQKLVLKTVRDLYDLDFDIDML